MVKPGLINLDFADVESIMKSMGKAMMGTGEAEGEKRALQSAELALNNPLIDEYSLQGAKGLLVNITGGKDLKLFEVEEAVNKVRAEVDSEAEVIIGSITDNSLEGKMRVSIVATSLDGMSPEEKSVVSMVHRIHNRNTGYNNNSSSLVPNQPSFSATEGATALDMDSNIEKDNVTVNKNISAKEGLVDESLTQNISLENATYLHNIENDGSDEHLNKNDEPTFEVESIELATPQLFSDDTENHIIKEDIEEKEEQRPVVFESSENSKTKEPEMFKKLDFEEDFEIPAFLRKQKN